MNKTTVTQRWQIAASPDSEVLLRLQEKLNISATWAKLFALRGITTPDQAKAFVNPSLEQLHNPFLMKGMHEAVGRLALAIEQNQRILVYGDYDVDGTCSVALMHGFLQSIGANSAYYIPDRYKEGYGVSYQGVQHAIDESFDLLIALDCGIKAVEKVTYAVENGVDVIICDHHTPGVELPPAFAILNPKQETCNYPFKELCGCGIGFKFIQGLAQRVGLDEELVYKYLDLAAISASCDIVPLVDENRVLVHEGLKRIKKNPSPAVHALLGEVPEDKNLTVSDLVFGIGPKINAAGRINHASAAVELLLQTDSLAAAQLVKGINTDNETRKSLDRDITAEAIQLIEENPQWKQAKSTVLFAPDWHKGVVGIVASRVIEKHYKPTIILTQSDDKVVGSARSVKGFDVYEALCECEELMEQFGGHKYAAGLTMKPGNVDIFRKKFDEVVSKRITAEQLIPEIKIDMELSFDAITKQFYNTLKRFGPFGPANMKPTFITKGVLSTSNTRIVGSDESHLKVEFEQNGVRMQGIGFGMANQLDLLQDGTLVDIAYSLEENHWNKQVTIQLALRGIRPSQG